MSHSTPHSTHTTHTAHKTPHKAGIMSMSLFLFVRHGILRRQNPLRLGILFLPFFYGFTLGLLVFFVVYKGSPGLGLDSLPIWATIAIVVGVAILSAVLTWWFVVPYMELHINARFDEYGQLRAEKNQTNDLHSSEWKVVARRLFLAATQRTIWLRSFVFRRLPSTHFLLVADDQPVFAEEEEEAQGKRNAVAREPTIAKQLTEEAAIIDKSEDTDSEAELEPSSSRPGLKGEEFDARAEEVFSFLQVLTACVGGFSHGANDVSNSIGPFAVVIAIYVHDDTLQKTDVAWWILLIGGSGIVIGLATWGYRVMATVGEKVTKLTPTRGFTIEFGAAMTVLIASRLQIPVSTTHCVVGSVFFVGLLDGVKAVNMRVVVGIFASWVVTLPFTGVLTAAIFAILRYCFL
eukprot:TRINITY_DN6816_c0_g1_i1.p1 TRINITY_DN6816_c0_g1~~TRINITY_DN6816_c0_g1_i1.p1  ORF type:complete len:405 (-),score=48.24 TRINITY_DN6816_c0_g1_i1:39-1253(-)